jgi:hypothetical protein
MLSCELVPLFGSPEWVIFYKFSDSDRPPKNLTSTKTGFYNRVGVYLFQQGSERDDCVGSRYGKSRQTARDAEVFKRIWLGTDPEARGTGD